MIYYFSGTGNSREVAERLAAEIHDYAINITYSEHYRPETSQAIGFVFPVYAWGIPEIMLQFIQQLHLTQVPPYVYMVCTCGDDIGLTYEEFKKTLKTKNLKVDAAWSVVMPNTYVALPGFDIDPHDLAQHKIKEALTRIKEIGSCINKQKRHVVDINPGSYAWLKSYLLRPLFKGILTNDKQFKVNTDCIHCGICANVCPKGNISYSSNGRPYWNGDCANCLACYHSCPQHAINYGFFTKKKGQYLLKKMIHFIK